MKHRASTNSCQAILSFAISCSSFHDLPTLFIFIFISLLRVFSSLPLLFLLSIERAFLFSQCVFFRMPASVPHFLIHGWSLFTSHYKLHISDFIIYHFRPTILRDSLTWFQTNYPTWFSYTISDQLSYVILLFLFRPTILCDFLILFQTYYPTWFSYSISDLISYTIFFYDFKPTIRHDSHISDLLSNMVLLYHVRSTILHDFPIPFKTYYPCYSPIPFQTYNPMWFSIHFIPTILCDSLIQFLTYYPTWFFYTISDLLSYVILLYHFLPTFLSSISYHFRFIILCNYLIPLQSCSVQTPVNECL